MVAVSNGETIKIFLRVKHRRSVCIWTFLSSLERTNHRRSLEIISFSSCVSFSFSSCLNAVAQGMQSNTAGVYVRAQSAGGFRGKLCLVPFLGVFKGMPVPGRDKGDRLEPWPLRASNIPIKSDTPSPGSQICQNLFARSRVICRRKTCIRKTLKYFWYLGFI